jgi:hypothetical protein
MEPEGSLPHSQKPATCPYPYASTHKIQAIDKHKQSNLKDHNSVTHNSVTHNSVTHNNVTHNSVTHNSVTHKYHQCRFYIYLHVVSICGTLR